MSRAVGRHHAGAHVSSASPRRTAAAAAPDSRRALREAGAHRSSATRGISRITLPTAAALTVSVVAAGAAGASTIDAASTMSLGNHSSAAATSSSSTDASARIGADRGNIARTVSRSVPRPTLTERGVTSDAAGIAATTAVFSGKKAAATKAAAKKAAAKKAARTKAAKATKRVALQTSAKRTTRTSGLAKKRVKTREGRSAGSYGWTCAIASCGGSFTSPFGARWGRAHLGDDFSVPVGTSLRAMNSATVVAAGSYGGMGNRVELDFGNGITAVYAHMSSISVSVGQKLSAGERIGLSGNTGNSTGPHLHLEIHINGTPIDPAPWLRGHGIF